MTCLELIEDQRAKDDPDHAANTRALRNVQSEFPFTAEMLHSVQTLQPGENVDDYLAAFTENASRHHYNRMMLQRDAVRKGLPIIRIKYSIQEGKSPAKLPPKMQSQMFDLFPQLSLLLVAGSRYMIDSNVQPHKGISRYTPALFHSIVFDTNRKAENERFCRDFQAAGPGEIIDFPYEPKFIHLILERGASLPEGQWLEKLPKQFPFRTFDEATRYFGHQAPPPEASAAHVDSKSLQDLVIIPFSARMHIQKLKVDIGKRKKHQANYRRIPLEPLYASTVHGLQGMTVSKLLVDWNNVDLMDLNMLYVILTRVKTANSLRCLPIRTDLVSPAKGSAAVSAATKGGKPKAPKSRKKVTYSVWLENTLTHKTWNPLLKSFMEAVRYSADNNVTFSQAQELLSSATSLSKSV